MIIKTVLAETLKEPDIVKTIGEMKIFGDKGVNDIFNWSIGIGGTIALGIIIFGGVLYITSAGNGSRQDNAKEWIWAAVCGLILLAAGYIILNTVNPAILGE